MTVTVGDKSVRGRAGGFRLALLAAALVATVGLSPARAEASRNVGAGAMTGTVTFQAPGVPASGEPCAATSFTLSGTATAVVYNTVIMGHAGTVSIAGAGGATCEATSGGSGTLTLTNVRGTGVTGSEIDCANPTATPATTLTGGYTRTAIDIEAVVGGSCKINGYDAPVLVTFRGVLEPSGFSVGGTPTLIAPGINAPIRQATLQGAFAVEPA